MLRRILIITTGGTIGALMLALVSLRVGALFGAGAQLDAYFIGVSLPAVVLSLAAAVVTSLVTPRLANRPTTARQLAGEWSVSAGVVGGAFAVFTVLASPLIVHILAPGESRAGLALASHVLRIYSISVPMTFSAIVLSAYGYANGRVWAGGGSTAVYGLTWFCLLFAHPFTKDVSGVAYAGVVATVVQLGVAFVLCGGREAIPWPRWRWRGNTAAMAAAAFGVGANVAISKANLLLDPLFGSFIGQGAVGRLTFAYRIVTVLIAVCGQGAALTILAARRGDDEATATGLAITALIGTGVATAVAVAFRPIAPLLLAHGSFSRHDSVVVGDLVASYSGFIAIISLGWALESALYARNMIWKVTRLNVLPLVVNIGLSAALIGPLGVFARPVAVTTGAILYVALLMRALGNVSTTLRPRKIVPVRSVMVLAGSILVADVVGLAAVEALWGRATPLAATVLVGVSGIATLGYVRHWLSGREAIVG